MASQRVSRRTMDLAVLLVVGLAAFEARGAAPDPMRAAADDGRSAADDGRSAADDRWSADDGWSADAVGRRWAG